MKQTKTIEVSAIRKYMFDKCRFLSGKLRELDYQTSCGIGELDSRISERNYCIGRIMNLLFIMEDIGIISIERRELLEKILFPHSE